MHLISITDITGLKDFNSEVRELENWLEKSSKCLEEISEDSLVNDVETTKFKLEQIKSLSDEITKKKPLVESLQTKTNTLLENSEPNFSSVLNSKLEGISRSWQSIVDGAKMQTDKYEGILRKNDEVNITIHFFFFFL